MSSGLCPKGAVDGPILDHGTAGCSDTLLVEIRLRSKEVDRQSQLHGYAVPYLFPVATCEYSLQFLGMVRPVSHSYERGLNVFDGGCLVPVSSLLYGSLTVSYLRSNDVFLFECVSQCSSQCRTDTLPGGVCPEVRRRSCEGALLSGLIADV